VARRVKQTVTKGNVAVLTKLSARLLLPGRAFPMLTAIPALNQFLCALHMSNVLGVTVKTRLNVLPLPLSFFLKLLKLSSKLVMLKL
jgi:hypothetical protein